MKGFSTIFRNKTLLTLILLLAGVIRLWQLDALPAEMWGDVIEGYKLARQVLNGDFYWRYEFGGDGPLLSYLIAGLSLPLGLSFYTIKLVTVLVGIALVGGVYLLGIEYANKQIALLAAFLTAVSKWPVIFSRMAKPHILAALFASLSFVFFLRFLRDRNIFYGVLTGATVGLGMYTQAAFWGVPLAVGVCVALAYVFGGTSKGSFSMSHVLILFIPMLVIMLPLFSDFIFRLGYLGEKQSFFSEKLVPRDGKITTVIEGMTINLVNNLGMFTFEGGPTFRNNPPGTPQLDFVSGLFLILGIYYGVRLLLTGKLSGRRSGSFIVPLFLIQIPSLLDINTLSGPNAGRTVALVPWTYILVAAGMWIFVKKSPARVRNMLLSVFLFTIVGLNLKQVFIDYPRHLPNQNTPFGKIIAREIDSLPENTSVYVIGCCWGEWGQPEPNAIRFAIETDRNVRFFAADDNPDNFSCEVVKRESRRVFIVTDPTDTSIIRAVKECYPAGGISMIKENGYEVAWSLRS